MPTTAGLAIGNEVATTDDEVLSLLVRLLAGRCDGAHRQDGVGFSRFDAERGHTLADKPVRMWSDFDRWNAYRLLSRYRRTQLKDHWQFVPAVRNPFEQATVTTPTTIVKKVLGFNNPHRLTLTTYEGREMIEVKLDWYGDRFNEVKAAIKNLPGRRWDGEKKKWYLPLHIDTLEPAVAIVDQYQVVVDDDVAERMTAIVGDYRHRLHLSAAKEVELHIPGLIGEPFGFQKVGILYARDTPSVLIADEPGLGKTLEALGTMALTASWPALAVVPASMKQPWKREAAKWIEALRDPAAVAVIDGHCTAGTTYRLDRLHELEQQVRSQQTTVIPKGAGVGQLSLNGEGVLAEHEVLLAHRNSARANLRGMWPLVHPNLKLVIANYDVLYSWRGVLRQLGFKMIVGDEGHLMKSGKAKRTKAFRMIAHGLELADHGPHTKVCAPIPRIALMTGTPVVNHPLELWTLLTLLGIEEEFGPYQAYKARYVDSYGNRQTEALQELNRILRTKCLVRRKKADVLPDLPPKIEAVVPIELDNAQAYFDAEANIGDYFATKRSEDDGFVAELQRHGEFLGFSGDDLAAYVAKEQRKKYDAVYRMAETNAELLRWEALKQLAARGKLAGVLDWIDQFLESGQKLVVFATHIEVVKTIAAHYHAPSILGETKMDDRMAAVDVFQTNPATRLIVGNMQAMGVGLTLTAASNVAMVEYGWNPAQMDQAADRLHRIGQRDTVNVWNLVGMIPEHHAPTRTVLRAVIGNDGEPIVREDGSVLEEVVEILDTETVDHDIVELIAKKRLVVDAVTDGKGVVEDIGILSELKERLEARLRRRGGRDGT